MAGKKGRPPKVTGEGTAVRLDSDIVAMAKVIALSKRIPMSEYLSSHLRPIITKEYPEAGKILFNTEAEK